MDNKKIKVLAYCDSPTVATGFATVSRNILMGLHATGRYDVVILGINYFGTPHNLPFPIYPTAINSQNDPYGRSWAKEMMKSSEFDILFTLQDSFILDFMKDVIQDLRAKNPRLRWINYFPVDGRPKKQWIEAMNLADYPITYTKWGMEQCNEVLPESKDKIDYIYHGVNVKDFHPLPKDDVERFRRQYFGHLNSRYIICNVNRNQQRKDIPRGMQAFKLFKEKYPNSLLYQHCATVDHGWNLVEVANNIGLHINEDICFPNNFNVNQGYPIAILNQIYNASDVVISSTTGEGALHEDSLIYTKRGLVPIKDVNEKDTVLTHTGRFMNVGKKLRVDSPESVFKLRLFKFNEPLLLTGDHPILTDRGFVRVDTLREDDKVLFAKKKREIKDIDFIDLREFSNCDDFVCDECIKGKHSGKKFNRFLNINEDILWLIGIYLAEGSITNNSVRFSLHKDESFIYERISSIFDRHINIFGEYKKTKFFNSNKDNSGTICIHNYAVARILKTLCGVGSGNKKIPEFIYDLPKFKIEAIISGMLDGDGDSNDTSKSWQKFRYKSISKHLAYGLRDLLLITGVVASVRLADNSCGFGNNNIYEVIVMKNGVFTYKNDTVFSKRYTNTDEYVCLDILSLEKKSGFSGVFYDIQVPGDNSYTTSVCTVHNCGLAQVEAMACCKPVISPDNTACTEIVGDNRGILVPSGWNNNAWTILPNDNEILRPLADVDAMAKAMENLYTDKKLAMELAINGYKWATSTIKWDKNIVPKWVEVFDKAVESSKSCAKASTGGDISVLEV